MEGVLALELAQRFLVFVVDETDCALCKGTLAGETGTETYSGNEVRHWR
jgi:hypothetical protein